MKFSFFSTSGKEYSIDIDPNATIADAKQIVQIFYSIDMSSCTMIYHNHILHDNEKLSKYANLTPPGINVFIQSEAQNYVDNIQKSAYENCLNTSRGESIQISSKLLTFKKISVLPNSENVDVSPLNILVPLDKSFEQALQSATTFISDINNYTIFRAKSPMVADSRLCEFNLHKNSIISVHSNPLSFEENKTISIRIIKHAGDDTAKLDKSENDIIPLKVSEDTYISELKDIASREMFEAKKENISTLKLTYGQITLVDSRQLSFYTQIVDESEIVASVSSSNSSEKVVVVESLSFTKNITLNFKLHEYVQAIKEEIRKLWQFSDSSQNLFYNHSFLYNRSLIATLTENRIFAVQMRTSTEPVYGVSFDSKREFYFDVPDDQPVLNLKRQISDFLEIPICDQLLFYHERELENDVKMGELSIAYYDLLECKLQKPSETLDIYIKINDSHTEMQVSPEFYISDLSYKLKNCVLNDFSPKRYNLSLPTKIVGKSECVGNVEFGNNSEFVLLEKKNLIYINIQTVTNDCFILPINADTKIIHFRQILYHLTGIDALKQKLYFDGFLIADNNKSLISYGIKNLNTIHVLISQ